MSSPVHRSPLLTGGHPWGYPSLQAKPRPHSTSPPPRPSGRRCVPQGPLGTPDSRGVGPLKCGAPGGAAQPRPEGHRAWGSQAGGRDRPAVKQATAVWKEACGAWADKGLGGPLGTRDTEDTEAGVVTVRTGGGRKPSPSTGQGAHASRKQRGQGVTAEAGKGWVADEAGGE